MELVDVLTVARLVHLGRGVVQVKGCAGHRDAVTGRVDVSRPANHRPRSLHNVVRQVRNLATNRLEAKVSVLAIDGNQCRAVMAAADDRLRRGYRLTLGCNKPLIPIAGQALDGV